ncbi:LuxR family transcriptional regulator [Winogradskyella sp. PC-19]|uniref:triple tyrosine motif-containing protein n=1 Tax=unclassified Winogradskyella TaxID=2615021 RepID=UPI000B3C6203|nr:MULTISPECIES: triple tyrosine motif-containing protein [unclassified Winogradskyella]ARV09405.1 LuxR family transcriptional regulator [Winogradskyella sp. PC-19]RZN79245.1 MAG: LuxR family transcriptional regulator [Winogradskyella sp.]
MLLKTYKLIFEKIAFYLIYIFFITSASAQEFPPIERFTPQDYKADDQNWSISQDNDKNIYVANNKGLLEYNGARWNLYTLADQSIIRSVAVINDLVYTGSYMNFGFWKRDSFGTLIYESISENLDENLLEDEEFWNIIPYGEFVLFQSLDRIYIYNTSKKTFRIIKSKTAITKAFRVDESIYFQESGVGISKIENGKAVLISDEKLLKEEEIVNIYKNDNKLLIHSRESGFYEYYNGDLKKWEISSNPLLSQVSVYNSIRLRNGNFILGTISNGIIKLDKKGNVLFRMNKNSGLSNNTVLSVFQDISGNIWMGLDNGINVLNLNSPYRVYTDNQGYLGTVYASEKTSENIYLGTNQGLFYKPINSSDKFKLIPKTKGQVWFLKQINGTLFCGHDKGSFEIKNSTAVEISTEEGSWIIKSIKKRPDLLMIGNYNGLSVIEKSSAGIWKFRNKVEGFDISSRYFEFVNDSELLVSHEYKGVYKLNLDNDLSKVISSNKLEVDKGIGSSLIHYKGEILYVYHDGVFSYDDKKEVFKKTDLLKPYFTASNYASGNLVYDENKDRLWSFFNNQLIFIEPGKLTEKPIINTIDLPSDLRKSKPGFENILYLKNNSYLLGTTDGYLVIDTEKFNVKEYTISIDNASYLILQQDIQPIDISTDIFLKNKQNDLYFTYSVSDFVKLSPSFYQYRLVGIYDYWSEWSSKSDILFENLPHGDYTFEVRAKVGSDISSNTATFNFTIEKPWYLKPFAIAGYVLLFIVIASLIQYLNRLYYKRQKDSLLTTKEKELEIKELESQRQLMEYKNKSLQQDIENKNRELGLSTMTLIRKNEFLATLKKELNDLEKGKELNKIIKIIDKNINNTEDWKFFEEAFNNADKDFLKKVKKKHPALTPNDLKLCAYLRLNLSSKEIAPLLNISHRSVEVKRYRLRKKMELSHETSLTNYILEI